MQPRSLSWRVAALAWSLCLGAPLLAGVLEVPGDAADLATALTLAAPGDVIVLHGGVHPPCVIDKPLTLMGGSARPHIRSPLPGEGTGFGDGWAIKLEGPGAGIVALVDLDVGDTLDGSWFLIPSPSIRAESFDQLRIVHCDVRGPRWENVVDPFLPATGAAAVSALAVDLLVVDSTVIGGTISEIPYDPADPYAPNGGPAISALAARIVVLDSTVLGGDGGDLVVGDPGLPCGSTCDDVTGGRGGTAIGVFQTTYHAGSTILGGQGGTITCEQPGGPALLCEKPDGDAIDSFGHEVALGDALSSSGPMLPDTLWSLSWVSASPQVLFLSSLEPLPAIDMGLAGWLFMDPLEMNVRVVSGLGAQTADFRVLPDPALLGLPIVFQVYDPATGFSRPVVGAALFG